MKKALMFSKNKLQTIAAALIDIAFWDESAAKHLTENYKSAVLKQKRQYESIANEIRYYCQFAGSNGEALAFERWELECIARALDISSIRKANEASNPQNSADPERRELLLKQAAALKELYFIVKDHLSGIDGGGEGAGLSPLPD